MLDSLGLRTVVWRVSGHPSAGPAPACPPCLATWGPWELRQVGKALHRGPYLLESRV